jgi:hypothetical protein
VKGVTLIHTTFVFTTIVDTTHFLLSLLYWLIFALFNVVFMNLEGEIIRSYITTLVKTRRAIRGVKIGYLPLLNVLGIGKRMRAYEISNELGYGKQHTRNRLERAIRAGYVIKDGLYYSLTDRGLLIAKTISENFAPHLERIKAMILEDVRKHL